MMVKLIKEEYNKLDQSLQSLNEERTEHVDKKVLLSVMNKSQIKDY